MLTKFLDGAPLKAQVSGEVEGIACRFDTPDRIGDVFLKGAFAGSIDRMRVQKSVFPMMHEHGNGVAGFADLPVGVWLELAERDEGLHVRGQIELSIPNTDRIVASAKAGALFLSVGVIPRAMHDEAWLPTSAPNKHPGGRVIKNCDLIEISLTARPMGYGTGVTAKSLRDNGSLRELEKHLCTLGLSRREAQRAGTSLWPILTHAEPDDSAELQELGAALKTLSTSLRS